MTATATGFEITAEELPDTDASIPCEMLWLGLPCGQPAAYRVRVRCACRHHAEWSARAVFVCSHCYGALVLGQVTCEFKYQKVEWLGEL